MASGTTGVMAGVSMNHSALGLTRLGSRQVCLSPDVSDVYKVVCEGRILDKVRYYSLLPADVVGKPIQYAERGNKLFFYPVPDKVYRIEMTWTGGPAANEGFQVSDEWLALYHVELAKVKAV